MHVFQNTRKEVSAAYFVNWGIYARGFNVVNVDATKLTHILYAFANVKEDGTVALTDTYSDLEKHFDASHTVDGKADSWNDPGNNVYGNIKQFFLLKKKHRHLKVSLSIGGWTLSANFSPVAASASARQKFITSSIKLLTDLGFDGLDIDWEYPANDNDAQNYVTLLSETRQALDQLASSKNERTKYLLTAAMPCGPAKYKIMHLRNMNNYLDYFYLMAYDYEGSWSSVTGHQANLFGGAINTDQAVRYYLNQTIPHHKIILGMPMYGRSFANTDGLNCPFQGVGGGTWEQGVYDYKVLPQPGAQESHDQDSVASWSYDPGKKELVTYDSPRIIAEKCKYIREHGLGGTMFWELSGDSPSDNTKSLLAARHKALDGHLEDSPNHLDFPDSVYDNIRSKMN